MGGVSGPQVSQVGSQLTSFLFLVGPVKKVYLGLFTILYLIIGSLVGVDLYSIKEAIDYNSAQADTLQSVASCMDSYTTFDSATYLSSVDSIITDVRVNLAFYWLTIITFASILVFYGLALVLRKMAQRTHSVNRNHT